MLCPCGSGADYQDCCAPLHRQKAVAQTAEQLMRSRYAAYVAHEIDYLVATTVPSQQALLDREDMARWSRQAEWLGLDVLRHGQPETEPCAGGFCGAFCRTGAGKAARGAFGVCACGRPLVFHRPDRAAAADEATVHLRFGAQV